MGILNGIFRRASWWRHCWQGLIVVLLFCGSRSLLAQNFAPPASVQKLAFYPQGGNFFGDLTAEARYGGPVPITFGNPSHLGNNSPRPGSNVLGDLMNGVVFNYQHRYDISALDLAIAQDASVLLLSGATLHNISTRLFVDTGDNALIAGFILNGSGNRTVLIRALGPTLSGFRVTAGWQIRRSNYAAQQGIARL